MKNVNLYQFEDYIDFINKKIAANKRGYQSLLCQSMNSPRSHLTNIISGRAQLSPEQAIKLCKFWGFNEIETSYFCELVYLDRGGSPEIKEYHLKKIKSLKKEMRKLSSVIKADQISEENKKKYYQAWYTPIIHIATSIPEFQTLEALVTLLRIPKSQVEISLNLLKQLKLVKSTGGKFKCTPNNLHIDMQEEYYLFYHLNSRMQAFRQLQEKQAADINNLFFTTTVSLSLKDYNAFLDKFSNLIKEFQEQLPQSKEEKVCVINLDYFKIN
jgi:uncharacterized protein (TIGR02147 family)